MVYKHLFFDLDHTIWDFHRNSHEAIEEVFDNFHIQKLGGIDFNSFLKRYREVNGSLWKQYNHGKINKSELRDARFKRVLSSFDLDKSLDSRLLEKLYMDVCPRKPNLVEGALDLLDYLQAKGYDLHILTNGFEETTITKLSSSNILDYFKVTVTSEGLQTTKPNAEFFERAMEKAKSTPEDTLMIGDNLDTDIKGAKNVGIDQVYYNPEENKHKEEVTFEIKRLRELKEIL